MGNCVHILFTVPLELFKHEEVINLAAEDKKWINSQDTLKKNEKGKIGRPKERKRSALQESVDRFMSDCSKEVEEQGYSGLF